MTTATSQPSIEIFGITIQEPVVTLTDFLVTIVCMYAFFALRKKGFPEKHRVLMLYFFAIMGAAAFLGGVLNHAFQYAVGLVWKTPAWLVSMLSIASIERASIIYAQKVMSHKVGRFLEVANIVELLIFATLAYSTLNFIFIEIHVVYGLGIVVLPIHFYVFWKTRSRASLIFCRTVLFATLATFFYTSGIGIHKWFNHLDLAHTVMAFSMYFFYLGTLRMTSLQKKNIVENPASFFTCFYLLFK